MEVKNNWENQLESSDLTVTDFKQQLELFRKGAQFSDLERPATLGDGIIRFGQDEISDYVEAYALKGKTLSIKKFVPASGAASRMFKHLFNFIETKTKDSKTEELLNQFYLLPFSNIVPTSITSEELIRFILTEDGLNFGQLPKGLIPFHRTNKGTKTPVEEHLTEAGLSASSRGSCNIEFTVSPEHESGFNQLLSKVLPQYEQLFNATYNIDFSYQNPKTNTVAANDNNEPFITDQDELILRPGGHGSLIHNLNNVDADLVFIKNIDNVQPDALKGDTITYKKALAGYLLEIKELVHNSLNKLVDSEQKPNQADLDKLNALFKEYNLPTTGKELATWLNRPIRVCGMVKNEGEPGGGPFWVKSNGKLSLQIVEKAQVDLTLSDQNKIMQDSTHFNPVDLVCYLKDFQGNSFDLTQFTDPDTYFISEKSYQGKTIKALEHPGLWNGAMANWITIFVEVPSSTFSPVKTVNDLLKPAHQA